MKLWKKVLAATAASACCLSFAQVSGFQNLLQTAEPVLSASAASGTYEDLTYSVNSFSTFGGDYLLGWIPLNFITATLLVVIPAAIAIGLIAWRNDATEKAAPSGGTLPPQGQC